LGPPTLFALNEPANIALLQDLHQILSTTRSAGVQFLTVVAGRLAAARALRPDAANVVLALTEVKLLLGWITDHQTRQELVELVGQRQAPAGRAASWPPARCTHRPGTAAPCSPARAC
jgi:hypothetical protein